jgi:FtsP/CotA-like multicopper oxidase with cupredoxin domain
MEPRLLRTPQGGILMKKQGLIVTAALAAIALIGVSSDAALSSAQAVVIPMNALNGSGENGAAVLTQLPKGVRVVVTLRNAPLTGQPTHIHAGSCPAPKPAPAFALKDTVNGKSVSFLPGVQLTALTHDAIIVHQSLRNIGVYVSCGDIR